MKNGPWSSQSKGQKWGIYPLAPSLTGQGVAPWGVSPLRSTGVPVSESPSRFLQSPMRLGPRETLHAAQARCHQATPECCRLLQQWLEDKRGVREGEAA